MNRTFRSILLACLLLSPLTLSAQEEGPEPGVYARFATVKGELLFKLSYEELPLTVSNFTALCEGKIPVPGKSGPYYNQTKIFRHIEGYALFMGDSGAEAAVDYVFPREETSPLTAATPGTLMMSSRRGKDDGGEIMILINGDEFLDRKYTPFGTLVSGEKTLLKLKRGDMIQSVSIERIGAAAQAFLPDEGSVRTMITDAREDQRAKFAEENPDVAAVIAQWGGDVAETETGILYKIVKEGEGSKPRPGDSVRMHYSGRLITGQEFDNSYMRNEPFQFDVGVDGVIPGWVETALDMKAGEQRTVIIPPELAYGQKGYGPIPPESWLIFDIELIDFQ